jgi:hypothetical protein
MKLKNTILAGTIVSVFAATGCSAPTNNAQNAAYRASNHVNNVTSGNGYASANRYDTNTVGKRMTNTVNRATNSVNRTVDRTANGIQIQQTEQ